MAVVIDNSDAARFPAQLKTAFTAGEFCGRLANLVGGNIEADADGDGRGRFQDVVNPRDVKSKFAKVSTLILHHETRPPGPPRRGWGGGGTRPYVTGNWL